MAKISRYKIASSKAKKLLGGKCIFCESKINLEFHHVKYADNYPKKKLKNGKWSAYQINPVYECLKNPEQFRLLCEKCHLTVTFALNDPKRTILVFKKMGKKSGFSDNQIKKIVMNLKKA